MIVSSFRDKEGKPRQETILNLGPVNDSNQEKTLTLPKRMIAHLDQKQIIIDGSDIQETIRQNWGAPAIIQQLWDRFSVDTCNFASYAPITNRQSTILKAMDIQPPKNYKI